MTEPPATEKISRGVISGDWTEGAAIGTRMVFRNVGSISCDAAERPQKVTNWEYFQGALLAFMIKRDGESHVLGTGVMIAPGLVVTASHIFTADIKHLLEGSAVPYLLGLRDHSVQLWRCEKISYDPQDDIALISVRPISEPPRDHTYFRFGLTTRTPKVGEDITLLGFRSEEEVVFNDEGAGLSGALYVSRGKVENVFYPFRDRLLAPFPAIEVSCGSPGGMSGGAALDSSGRLVGIISRSLETEDGCGPSLLSWIIKALGRELEIPWPAGVYKESVRLIDLDETAVSIEGRDAFRASADGKFEFKVWFDRGDA